MPPKYPCTVRGCEKPRHSHKPRCLAHSLKIIRNGTENGSNLTSSQRKAYVFSALAVLRSRLRHKCPDAHSTVNDLNALLRCRIEKVSLHDYARAKPIRKAHAILHAIHKRYEDHAAKVIIATVVGTLLALKLEPDLPERGEVYGSFQILRALSALLRPEIIKSGRLVLRRSRPYPAGGLVTGHLEHLVGSPIRYFLREVGQDFEREVLAHMLAHPGRKQRAIVITPFRKKERP